MKGKTVAIAMVIILIVAVVGVVLMVMATYKNNPTQKNTQSMDDQSYTEVGSFGWQ